MTRKPETQIEMCREYEHVLRKVHFLCFCEYEFRHPQDGQVRFSVVALILEPNPPPTRIVGFRQVVRLSNNEEMFVDS